MKNGVNEGKSNTEMVTISRGEYEEFQAQRERITALEKQVEQLMEAIRLSRRKQFGSSSEKLGEEGYEQLSLLFNEAEAYCTASEKKELTTVAAHTRQKRSSRLEEILPEDVPVEVVEHRLPAEELVCPACGTEMREIGKEVRRSLVMIPAQVKIREDWYYTYACRRCQEEGIQTPIAKAERTPAVISGSYASAEAIAHIMVQKFVMGSPLYRQEQEWNRQGVKLSRQTMSNWILRAAEDWLGRRCMRNCTGNWWGGMCSTRMKRRCRYCGSRGNPPRARVICGCTGQAGTRNTRLCCMSTARTENRRMQRCFWRGLPGGCTRTGILATTVCRNGSVWWAAGLTPGGSLTRR